MKVMKVYFIGESNKNYIEYIHTRNIVSINKHKWTESRSGEELIGSQFRMNSGDEIGQILTFKECNV